MITLNQLNQKKTTLKTAIKLLMSCLKNLEKNMVPWMMEAPHIRFLI